MVFQSHMMETIYTAGMTDFPQYSRYHIENILDETKDKIRRVLSRIRCATLVRVWWRSTNSSLCFLKCRRWGMPSHWLQVDSCRAGFKSKECLCWSVFYRSKNALFIAQNLKQHSASEEKVKVIRGRVTLGTLYVRLWCWNNRELP